MSDKNLVLLSWSETAPAYEAFSKLRGTDAGGVRVDSAAVLERNADGTLKVTDGQDDVIGLGTLGGSSIGALVGILGGPLGMLLGFAGGGLIGSAVDVSRGIDSDSVVGEMSKALPPGHGGVILEVEEVSTEALDGLARETGATILRRSEDEVLDEIAAAEEAADAAARAADEKVREQKKAERKEKRDERVAEVKSKLGIGSEG